MQFRMVHHLTLLAGGVSQTFDSIMGRFDLGELTGNKS